jgi:hypothetical protein
MGCALQSAAPAVVGQSLTAIEALGLRCGDGIKDNVPSGLFQWSCRGMMAGAPTTVLVDGNDKGVTAIALVTDGSTDATLAAAQFGRLVDAVPPMRTAPILKDTVAGWTGAQQVRTIGGVRISASCETQCHISVMPAGDALRPLPLP